jgi:hypothetical protein
MITWKDVQVAKARGEQLEAEAAHYAQLDRPSRRVQRPLLATAAAGLGGRLVQMGQRLEAAGGMGLNLPERRQVASGPVQTSC